MNPLLFFILFVAGVPIAALIATLILVFGLMVELSGVDGRVLLPLLVFIGSPFLFLLILYVFGYILWANRHKKVGDLLSISSIDNIISPAQH